MVKLQKFYWHLLATSIFHLASEKKFSVATFHLISEPAWYLVQCQLFAKATLNQASNEMILFTVVHIYEQLCHFPEQERQCAVL